MFIGVILLLVVTLVNAQVTGVFYVSFTNGDNKNTGLTQDLPFKTVDPIFNLTGSSTTYDSLTINFLPGEHFFTRTFEVSGARIKTISLIGSFFPIWR